MMTRLGQSDTPSLLSQYQTNLPQTFCILFPTPKGIVQRAYPVHPFTTAFLTAIAASDIKKIARPSLTLPHTGSPPVAVPPTSSHIPTSRYQ
jgi:hypothetical protein